MPLTKDNVRMYIVGTMLKAAKRLKATLHDKYPINVGSSMWLLG